MNDISSVANIKRMVDSFYKKVRKDRLLSQVFASRKKEHEWRPHMERMYAFWNAMLFAEKGFSGNPMAKHLGLPISKQHFPQWLLLFSQTIDASFAGPKAKEAKKTANSIAQLMDFKINGLRV